MLRSTLKIEKENVILTADFRQLKCLQRLFKGFIRRFGKVFRPFRPFQVGNGDKKGRPERPFWCWLGYNLKETVVLIRSLSSTLFLASFFRDHNDDDNDKSNYILNDILNDARNDDRIQNVGKNVGKNVLLLNILM